MPSPCLLALAVLHVQPLQWERRTNDLAERPRKLFYLLVGLAVVLTIVFYVSAPTLLRLFGASDVTLTYATDYARIYILGSFFVLIVLA